MTHTPSFPLKVICDWIGNKKKKKKTKKKNLINKSVGSIGVWVFKEKLVIKIIFMSGLETRGLD